MKNEEMNLLVETIGLHELCETYANVRELQETMKALTNRDELPPESRDALIERGNKLLSQLLSGKAGGMECRMRTSETAEPPICPPFTHPEMRFDPVTKRYWLSEQELNLIKAALGEDQGSPLSTTPPDVN